MVEKKKVALQALLDVKRFIPAPRDLLKPFPPPKKGELVMQGVSADLLSYAFGYIPGVGDIVGQFVNDNIMADVLQKLAPAELSEFREQNRIYPNGVALLRTFQRTRLAPGSKP
ncbi:hypothetical protein LCGC14_1780550 [marine sediment metagenome]|uniref:Uncharacterized protein n=1 Tax=marine sediment metagenome TaxID=412755 RepID=A0A0F9HI72_9ZZZZ